MTQLQPISIPFPLIIHQNPNVFTSTIANKFINDTDVTDKSKRGYTNALAQFLYWLDDNSITQPKREDILSYKDTLKADGLKPNTITAYIVVVKKFFAWLESNRLYDNVTNGIKGGGAVNGFLKDPLTTDQVRLLLGSIDQSKPDGVRNFNIINLMVHTALRTIEVVRADVSDMAVKSNKHVLYIQGKGRVEKDALIVLTDTVYNPLMSYLGNRKAQQDEPLFTSEANRSKGQRLTGYAISHIVKSALRTINLDSDRLTCHSLRHTSVTLALLGGASIQSAQSFARHVSLNTTMIYSHNIDRIKDAAEYNVDKMLE